MMHAIQVHEPGDITALRYEEVETPEPGPGQVRVRIRAAGVNHRDIWVRRGNFGANPTAVIPGSDGAGEVDAVGLGVNEWTMGQKVVINPGVSCGTCVACLSGVPSSCSAFFIYDGTYAEYAILPVENLVAMPSGLTFTEAASIGIPYVTAEDFLVRSGALPGQTLLLWGATGGLGVATLQLAKLRGIRVYAVTRSATRAEKLRQLQVDEVLVWDGHQSVAAQVREYTGGKGVDLVVDSLGQLTMAESLEAVTRGGTIISVGSTTGNQVTLDLGQVFRRRLTILGAFLGASAILPRILALFARGLLVPVIDQTYPLEQADQAHDQMENHGVVGKIILTP